MFSEALWLSDILTQYRCEEITDLSGNTKEWSDQSYTNTRCLIIIASESQCFCVCSCLFQALCLLTNIANGNSAKDCIMGNDDLVGKIVSYLVCSNLILLQSVLSLSHFMSFVGIFPEVHPRFYELQLHLLISLLFICFLIAYDFLARSNSMIEGRQRERLITDITLNFITLSHVKS